MKRLIALASLWLTACAAGDAGLSDIHDDIVSDLPSVTHIDPDAFEQLDRDDVLLLDIREPGEYAVSRLPGAIWVSPDIDPESAIIQIGNLSGKHVVVYCSVGRRSAIFAQRVEADFLNRGATKISNLEKGIFGWHNDKRDLIDAEGETDVVHPYNEVWKRYVSRQDMARYSPE